MLYVLLRLLLVEVAFNRVEDSVDKLGGFVGGETAGDFQGFVNCDRAWRWFVEKLVNGQAQDIAIDYGHA